MESWIFLFTFSFLLGWIKATTPQDSQENITVFVTSTTTICSRCTSITLTPTTLASMDLISIALSSTSLTPTTVASMDLMSMALTSTSVASMDLISMALTSSTLTPTTVASMDLISMALSSSTLTPTTVASMDLMSMALSSGTSSQPTTVVSMDLMSMALSSSTSSQPTSDSVPLTSGTAVTVTITAVTTEVTTKLFCPKRTVTSTKTACEKCIVRASYMTTNSGLIATVNSILATATPCVRCDNRPDCTEPLIPRTNADVIPCRICCTAK